MKTLTIVIPIYNEEERIEKSLKALKKPFNFKELKLEKIIFVDDGSKDNAKYIIRKAKLEKYFRIPVKILTYSTNKGRGYAVKLGCALSESNYTLYLDADFSIPLSNIKQFIPYMNKSYDLLIGSKKKPGAVALIDRGLIRNVVGFGHSFIASAVLGVFFWDFQGGFKIFSKKLIQEVFPRLKMNRWSFDMEILFLAKKLGFKTVELPVVWRHEEKGSKVRLIHDIIKALQDMFKIKINFLRGYYTTNKCLPPKSAFVNLLLRFFLGI